MKTELQILKEHIQTLKENQTEVLLRAETSAGSNYCQGITKGYSNVLDLIQILENLSGITLGIAAELLSTRNNNEQAASKE